MTYKPTPIAAGISAMFALTLCAPTQAQQAPPASAPSEPVEQIIVRGVRASMQKSLNQKRENEALVEIITAEDIGKMPDKNVADSLSRVSGVTTTSAGSSEGSFGENEHVQMRGLSSQFTLTTLNGHSVSSGDWFGPNIAAGGRSVSYTLLPSDLVGQITVYKSAQADLIEGGAAGTVDIDTRKPLSFPQKLTFSATVEGAYGSASKKPIRVSAPWLTGKMTATLSGFWRKSFRRNAAYAAQVPRVFGGIPCRPISPMRRSMERRPVI